MRKVTAVLILFIAMWLGVSYYFIMQHTILGKEAVINESIEFDDVTLQLDRLLLVNAERKPRDWDIEFERQKKIFEIMNKLPERLRHPFLRLSYIYSSPYSFDNQHYQTYLVGKCFFQENYPDSNQYHEYFRDNIKIRVVDFTGVGYSSGSGSLYEGGSKEIEITIRGRGFPIEYLQGGMEVIIKHLETGQERIIQLDYEDFQHYEYNDSLQPIKSLSSINL